jgi:hypothetical protein
MCQPITIKGRVLDAQNQPIAGATITLNRTGFTTVSAENGTFTIINTNLFETITITAVGYHLVQEANLRTQ